MTALDTAVNYQTSVVGFVPSTFDADWVARSALLEKTDTGMYAFKLSGGAAVGETTFGPFETSSIWRLLAQLVVFQQSTEDERWPGAVWPEAQAFKDAYTFIQRLPLPMIPMPEISLADDGEINFLWDHDSVHVDLGFYGTGTYSYFARGQHGPGIHDEDVPASKGLPAEITALLTA